MPGGLISILVRGCFLDSSDRSVFTNIIQLPKRSSVETYKLTDRK